MHPVRAFHCFCVCSRCADDGPAIETLSRCSQERRACRLTLTEIDSFLVTPWNLGNVPNPTTHTIVVKSRCSEKYAENTSAFCVCGSFLLLIYHNRQRRMAKNR